MNHKERNGRTCICTVAWHQTIVYYVLYITKIQYSAAAYIQDYSKTDLFIPNIRDNAIDDPTVILIIFIALHLLLLLIVIIFIINRIVNNKLGWLLFATAYLI